MNPDDHVCLCFRVSQRKLVNYLKREQPSVPSLLSECLGAGTGCQWCVPFLKKLHGQWEAGAEIGLDVSPENYAHQRQDYRARGRESVDGPAGEPGDR